MYFLIVGIITAFGYYGIGFNYKQISPLGLLVPLSFFITISLLMEGLADKKRHLNDYKTNTYPCIVIENSSTAGSDVMADPPPAAAAAGEDIENGNTGDNDNDNDDDDDDGDNKIPFKDVTIIPATTSSSSTTASTTATTPTVVQFNFIPRKDIRQGNLIVIRNREMIPADTVLLASSGDLGCAYIETSSIDGETNLKLRLSAKSKLHQQLESKLSSPKETMEDAIQRLSTFTSLGRSTCASNDVDIDIDEQNQQGNQGNIAVLATEAPNAHINTFTGKLSIPTTTIMEEEKDDNDNDTNTNNGMSIIPLDGDNLLLRGAILRNTEWAIGVVAFTGTDTKLSQNSIEAPTKFSQLDHFTNKCVIVMLFIEFISIVWLATAAVMSEEQQFEYLWYVSYVFTFVLRVVVLTCSFYLVKLRYVTLRTGMHVCLSNLFYSILFYSILFERC